MQILPSTLQDIQKDAQVITVHCPLNQESDHMMNEAFFKACRKHPYFINTARGGIVDEQGLIKALNQGWIEGAALDVISAEPMQMDSPLMGVKNLTITPHVAWAPYETRERLFRIVMDNLEAFLQGTPKNVVRK